MLRAERRRRIPFDFQRTSLAGLALDSETSSGLGKAPALQCRTPSRHHLELQDRRDYTPADRAARTCWLGCPGLLYYLAARDAKLSFSPVPSTWPLPPRPHLTNPKDIPSGLGLVFWADVKAIFNSNTTKSQLYGRGDDDEC
ncbi:hypothetical protein TNCV_493151 [Trichonephila clavipes]|nr:hypothetical protein TNCV_493151 [Trichonephila clavipes]